MTDLANRCESTCQAPRRLAIRLRPLTLLLRLIALSRQRRKLALMDDRLLRDIGMTREEADAEARRPPWDVPRHWLQQDQC